MTTSATMPTMNCRLPGEVDDRLVTALAELEALLDRPWSGQPTVGVELEGWNLEGKSGRPIPWDVTSLGKPAVVREVHPANFEFGLTHVNTRKRQDPFSAQLRQAKRLIGLLVEHGVRPVFIGSPPTLTTVDTHPSKMTPVARYHEIDRAIGANRKYSIDDERVKGYPEACNGSIMPEAACTSVQLNLEVTPAAFANMRDAALLISGLMVALGANEPLPWGTLRPDGSRIDIFELVTDDRAHFASDWSPSFYGYFENVVRRWPVIADLDPNNESDQNPLKPLINHNGTDWDWHRGKIVVRPHELVALLECREVSAQPTIVDNLALIAFQTGLITYFGARMEHWRKRIPFGTVRGNFYAGTAGIKEAQLKWPSRSRNVGMRTLSTSQLALELLPMAAAGLRIMGVDSREANFLLRIIQSRAELRRNGATWQRQAFARNFHVLRDPRKAATLTLQQYRERANNGLGSPVHTWPLSSA